MDGGTVAVYSDITELKQREESLSEKSAALEGSFGKARQVSGSAGLRLRFSPAARTSRSRAKRKKLTICFSDIAGFTETTDRMESEDLTQLLNHYLTEMSKIALQYGATIDKYVGDAIVMFFGDPEPRRQGGCAGRVKMALAMQRRIGELAGAGATPVSRRRCAAASASTPTIARSAISAAPTEWTTPSSAAP